MNAMQGKRKRKYVQFRSGLIFFSVILCSALITGYGLDRFIASRPLNEAVQSYLAENDQLPVSVENVRFQFRRGWLPTFAITAESLSAADQKCKDRNLVARGCLLYTSPSPRDRQKSRMPSSA